MPEENHTTDEEQSGGDSATSAVEARLPTPIAPIRAESGVIINIDQVQSIEISSRFTKEKTPDGWSITLHSNVKITIHLTTSMRKIEMLLIEGDVIERSATDLAILRKHSAEEYKAQRSASSLARSREELLQGKAPGETTV